MNMQPVSKTEWLSCAADKHSLIDFWRMGDQVISTDKSRMHVVEDSDHKIVAAMPDAALEKKLRAVMDMPRMHDSRITLSREMLLNALLGMNGDKVTLTFCSYDPFNPVRVCCEPDETRGIDTFALIMLENSE